MRQRSIEFRLTRHGDADRLITLDCRLCGAQFDWHPWDNAVYWTDVFLHMGQCSTSRAVPTVRVTSSAPRLLFVE